MWFRRRISSLLLVLRLASCVLGLATTSVWADPHGPDEIEPPPPTASDSDPTSDVDGDPDDYGVNDQGEDSPGFESWLHWIDWLSERITAIGR